jgi:hypothetical protein
MTLPAGHAELQAPEIFRAVIALVPDIRAASDEIEQARRLPGSVVTAMKGAGVQFRVLETLGMADGSVGWCAMINCDGGYITAFLDDAVGRSMYLTCSSGPRRRHRRPVRRCASPAAIA